MTSRRDGGTEHVTEPSLERLILNLTQEVRVRIRAPLTVHLRQLNVPVPSVYGPSADENPFMVRQAAASA